MKQIKSVGTLQNIFHEPLNVKRFYDGHGIYQFIIPIGR